MNRPAPAVELANLFALSPMREQPVQPYAEYGLIEDLLRELTSFKLASNVMSQHVTLPVLYKMKPYVLIVKLLLNI